jgi:hypothetical protein
LVSRGKKRLLVAAWAGVVGSLQARVAFETDHRALPIALELEGYTTLGAGGRVELHAAVAAIDQQGEGRAHQRATLGAGLGFEFLKGRIRVLLIPGIQLVKELGGSV